MNIKKLLVLLLAAVLLISMASCSDDGDEATDNAATSVEDAVYNGFSYTTNIDGTYELVSFTYTGVDPIDVEIPAQINERDVTSISADLFKAMKTIKKVTFAEGSKIKSIGEYAFYDCDSIEEIVLPETLVTLGQGAFQDCDNLKKVTFPAGLTEIPAYAFMDCVALEALELPAGLKVIGNSAFWGCDSLTEVVIPATLTDMGKAAFYECSKLKSATVLGTDLGKTVVNEDETETVHTIGEIVFNSCATDLIVKVTKDSEFAKYAEANNYNVEFVSAE